MFQRCWITRKVNCVADCQSGTPTPRSTNGIPVESVSVLAFTCSGGTGMGVGGAWPLNDAHARAATTRGRSTSTLYTRKAVSGKVFAVNLQMHMRSGPLLLFLPLLVSAQTVNT